ncbi:hypothetical protein D9M73_158030 [compost metagenome]
MFTQRRNVTGGGAVPGFIEPVKQRLAITLEARRDLLRQQLRFRFRGCACDDALHLCRIETTDDFVEQFPRLQIRLINKHAVDVFILVWPCLGEAGHYQVRLVAHFDEAFRRPAWQPRQCMQLLLDEVLVCALSLFHCRDHRSDAPVNPEALDTVLQPLR